MDPEKALLGSDVQLYEVEEDQDQDLAEKASIKYDMMSVLNSLGNEDFKSVYIALMPHIMEQPLDIQRQFCFEFLDKIEEVNNYTFPVNLDFVSEYSVSDFYNFLEFLEFDYINFLAGVWKLLPVNLKAIDIASYCNSESELVISKVDQVVQSEVFPKLVSLFLRTYTKEYLIKFIVEKTDKDRMLVFLKIKEGEQNE